MSAAPLWRGCFCPRGGTADTSGLEPDAARRRGSNPLEGTTMTIALTILFFVGEGACILFAVFWIYHLVSSIRSDTAGAPFVGMKREFIADILKFGELAENDVFYDLGCGDGRVLLSAVRDFGVRKAIGYEIAGWPYWQAKIALWRSGTKGKVQLRHANFFKANLSEATFFYLYLSSKSVDRFAFKIGVENKPGKKILCPMYEIDVKKHPKFQLIKSGNIRGMSIFLYTKMYSPLAILTPSP